MVRTRDLLVLTVFTLALRPLQPHLTEPEVPSSAAKRTEHEAVRWLQSSAKANVPIIWCLIKHSDDNFSQTAWLTVFTLALRPLQPHLTEPEVPSSAAKRTEHEAGRWLQSSAKVNVPITLCLIKHSDDNFSQTAWHYNQEGRNSHG
jgi:hypothetical protein